MDLLIIFVSALLSQIPHKLWLEKVTDPIINKILVPLKALVGFQLLFCITTRSCYKVVVNVRILNIGPGEPIDTFFGTNDTDR